jgi:mannose-6-phosphate isomerase-like protein (cupin superfamily)
VDCRRYYAKTAQGSGNISRELARSWLDASARVIIDIRAVELVAMAKSVPALDPGSSSSYWSRRRGADTAGQFALVEALVPQRVEPPPQVHTQDDEAYYIMEGNLAFTAAGTQIRGAAGSMVWLPRGVEHRPLPPHQSCDGSGQSSPPAGLAYGSR